MTLIKKYNDKPEVIANKSVIDHNQLTNREQYGAHPISAIRGLPEKLTKLKDKDNELEEKIETTSSNLSKLTEKVDEVESNAKKIDIIENAEDGTFTFTNYGATDSKTIQSGYQPDEDTLTLNDSKKMTLKQVHTDTSLEGTGTQANPLLVNIDNTTITKRIDGKLEAISLKTNGGTISGVTVKEELDNLNKDVERLDAHNSVQDNEIYDLQSRTKGMGGYLNSYNFGDFSKLTTEEVQNNLTAYALQQISITEKTDIFDGTKVINDYDRHLWRLTNTPNSNPVVFEWADLGITQEVSTATDSLLGLVKGSNGDLKGKVDINGEISINGLSETLELKQDKLTAGENITIQDNVISVDGETIKTFSGGDTTRDNNSEFYDFLRTLTPGEYFWLDRLKNNNHSRYSTVAGKILMQLVSVPERYTMPGSDSAISKTSRVELVNCFKLLAKGFTYEDKDVDLKDGPFTLNYNTIHKYDLTADLSDTKEYELYFAERAMVGVNLNAHFEYSFVGVSTTISANKPSTKVITRLDAITSITENNDQAVTSGAVYAALQGKQATLTSEQLNAVNSGATTTKINQIATNTTNIASLKTGKQDKLTAGENITIENNVISAKGGDLTNYYTKEEVNAMLPFSEDISGPLENI